MPTPYSTLQDRKASAIESLRQYLNKNGMILSIFSQSSSPTKSVTKPRWVIQCEDSNQLAYAMKFFATGDSKEQPLSCSMIAGGRDKTAKKGDALYNKSWSIDKSQFAGIDILIQDCRPLEFNFVEEKGERETKNFIEVSGNTMLIELHRKLRANNLHIPHLSGCLPYMTLAGGISTGSHSAQRFLADIVLSVKMLLPNGRIKVFNKNDPHFSTVTSPTMGLCGTILSVKLKAQQGRRMLERQSRNIEVSEIPKAVLSHSNEDDKKDISGITIMMTPNSDDDSICKFVEIRHVKEQKRQGGNPSLVVSKMQDRAAQAVSMGLPKVMRCVMKEFVIKDTAKCIGPIADNMGPEKQISANVTEVGIIVNIKKSEENIKFILDTVNRLTKKHPAAVSTAVFLRFPKAVGAENHVCCLDFASIGANQPTMKLFAKEFFEVMSENGYAPRAHYGKDHGLELNKCFDDWQHIKNNIQAFHIKHGTMNSQIEKRLNTLDLAASGQKQQVVVARPITRSQLLKFLRYLLEKLIQIRDFFNSIGSKHKKMVLSQRPSVFNTKSEIILKAAASDLKDAGDSEISNSSKNDSSSRFEL